MQGVFRVAPRAALEEVTAARLGRDERRYTRAKKLFPIDSEVMVGGALRFRPRILDCVVGSKRGFSGSRCCGFRTSAQERRKWGREEGKQCIAVGSDGGVECSLLGIGGN